jgi:hypothetical protein
MNDHANNAYKLDTSNSPAPIRTQEGCWRGGPINAATAERTRLVCSCCGTITNTRVITLAIGRVPPPPPMYLLFSYFVFGIQYVCAYIAYLCVYYCLGNAPRTIQCEG